MTTVGIIAPRAVAQIAQGHGVDYVEPTIVGNVVLIGEDGVLRLNPEFEGERYPSFAILLPGDVRVSDPTFDFERVRDYFTQVFAVLAGVAEPGAKIVFGSGGARRIPEGVDRDAAERRFAESLVEARDAAAVHGFRVMLEPLHQGETNLIHTLGEAAAFLDAHGIEEVPLVADLFHIEVEGESLSTVTEHIDRIGHAHIADAGRLWLGSGDGSWREFVATLRAAGFTGPVSLECNWGDDVQAEVAASIAALRELP
ncbi:sugar phosphate isomerase/epimerase family protein [Microbacterium murale]|uniref:D-psicose/D-tagatose/L-ribulose 3-epimerase n=1 Tax=Microbacterium murale TaxID=1081040 RepID=A0ABU0PA46_9MICO|nr:sugar phosphate isomerase/epimerase family protein [Microbacterium murale]MDQ0644205.1 D-psicose/D-tagatose/L-ribulose 3-epimerase [Microbacterium murale]